MYLSTTALFPAILLLINPVTARPRPSPQWSYTAPNGLKCPNIEPCPGEMPLNCGNGELFCNGWMFAIPRGKCSDCAGSVCAKSSDDYPGDSTPKSPTTSPRAAAGVAEGTTEKREPESDTGLEVRQVFGGYCQAGWDCACVSFDGKGYYSRGKGGQCEGGIESCSEDGGFLCSFGCRSKLLDEFTNAKCHALFPGTRAQCRLE